MELKLPTLGVTLPEGYEEFMKGMIECLYWTDQEQLGDDPGDLEPSFQLTLEAHGLAFWSRVWFYAKSSDQFTPEQMGHDWWLTSQGYGTGFWDRPEMYGEYLSQHLTKLSEDNTIDTVLNEEGLVDVA